MVVTFLIIVIIFWIVGVTFWRLEGNVIITVLFQLMAAMCTGVGAIASEKAQAQPLH